MTGPVGAPDALSTMRLARRQASIKTALDATRQELATGRRAERYAGGDPGRLLSLDAAIAAAEARSPLLGLAKARAGVTQTALETAQAAAPKDWAARLLGQVEAGDLASARLTARDARTALDQVASALSAQVDGRSLFGGDGGTVGPVIDVDRLLADVETALKGDPLGPMPGLDAATALGRVEQYLGFAPNAAVAPDDPTFAARAYLGGAGEAPPVELAERDLLSYGVRGDDPALRRLLGGLALAVVASTTTDAAALGVDPAATAAQKDSARMDLWREAATRLIEADDAVTARRATLGVAERRIEDAETWTRAQRDALELARGDLEGVDQFEAATRLTELETQLQALYEMTARASNLNLLSFLR